ncbi:twin-arginine translocase subunit TatC [Alterisphingorhabdus coralli]|uniref:Sec-independent protein translocase protein TatC n=1 Tax=Alterisphingorhabdus coralli TaxID=3071408 RepID=A0AA97I2V6_9SPHN|nr:twin-arginine translocase subunit TatC [Parasphingorhabdus sp. SCSIO 66989]WOE76653.1 twin-arginine translocase subunit TatC [Parasphingorhabdus sp. SCSIO 66989]
MPLLDHLIELRQRLLWSLVAFAIAFAACFAFSEEIFGILAQPLLTAFGGDEGKLIYTKLYEALFVELKVALFAAFFLSFPVIANQLWQFVAPGLYSNEKRAFLPFLLATPILFAAGASLAYFVVMPLMFNFLLEYEGDVGGLELQALPGIGDYLAFVMQIILAFGIAFLLPVLLLLLNRAGLVSREQLAKLRRYMVVGSFAVAAILTPPDMVSMLFLGLPLIALYEGSMLIMRFTEKRNQGSV